MGEASLLKCILVLGSLDGILCLFSSDGPFLNGLKGKGAAEVDGKEGPGGPGTALGLFDGGGVQTEELALGNVLFCSDIDGIGPISCPVGIRPISCSISSNKSGLKTLEISFRSSSS